MKLVPLTSDYELTTFDCGDNDLNEFLLCDAKKAHELRIANTFILEDDGRVAAYFCLLNDRISRSEITGSRWKKKNGFKELTKKEEDEHTRLMFFDMMDVE